MSSPADENLKSTATSAVASTDAPVSTSASLVGMARRAREYWTPVRAKSAFLSKGVLTPEEFVKAGDELCYRCPTWTWASSSSASSNKSYLPADKQFLITRSVPSTARVDSIEQSLTLTALQDGGDGDDDDWMVSSIVPAGEKAPGAADGGDNVDDLEDDFDILDINEDGEVVEQTEKKSSSTTTPSSSVPVEDKKSATVPENNYPDDEEYADMADFEDDNILMDDEATDDQQEKQNDASNSATVVPTRRYDISITYDKYYQTPRVWMTGLNERQQPLTVDELMQDVVTDYRHKTVTMEPHPHVSGRQASIHPCQHAKVMKVIVQNLLKASSNVDDEKNDGGDASGGDSAGATVDVTQYLFIFLKFVSSIIPTVNYDFTMDVQANTAK